VPIALSQLTHNGKTAQATTGFPHGFRVDQQVIISSNSNDADALLYKGVPPIRITNVPSATRFDYEMAGVPSGNGPADAGFSTYEKLSVPIGRGLFVTLFVTQQARLASLTRMHRGLRYFGSAAIFVPQGYSFRHGLVVG